MTIDAVLFDADGVLQRAPDGWLDLLRGLVGRDDGEAFLADLFAVERPCLAGKADMRDALDEVLQRWRARAPVDEALALWNRIQIDDEVMTAIAALRARGVRCYLATNQHTYRAAHMTTALGYGRHFDRCFFSCEIGHAKPHPAYFEAVIAAIAHPREHMLFIDDNESNVAAARAVGLRAAHVAPHAGIGALRPIFARYGLD